MLPSALPVYRGSRDCGLGTSQSRYLTSCAATAFYCAAIGQARVYLPYDQEDLDRDLSILTSALSVTGSVI